MYIYFGRLGSCWRAAGRPTHLPLLCKATRDCTCIMEKPPVNEKRDSDSGREASDEEKRVEAAVVTHEDLQNDPDAGLNDEERAKMVRASYRQTSRTHSY